MSANEDLDTRLSFLGIDDGACDQLRSIQPLIERVLPEILTQFYKHISRYHQVERLFPDQKTKDHAKAAQEQHWTLISSGTFNDQYVESVRRIGHAHHQLGLEPRWYIGGYAFILSELVANCAEELQQSLPGPENETARRETLAALIKSAFLDMDFAISIYLEEGKKEKTQALEKIAASFEQSIGGFVSSLAESSAELQAASESMSGSAKLTNEKSANVAAAAEQATSNVSAIASAVEEMSQSVKEISEQVHNAARVTRQVADRANETNDTIQGLVAASEKIGAVVDMIKDVADQTNLLALNATIEAARAGDAGRGFAVVASEVKALANQTASATEEIRDLVLQMQRVSGSSAEALAQIRAEISEVDTLSSSIASSVEEQSAATNEIARNTQEASSGTRLVSSSICEVQEATAETGAVAETVLRSASTLAEQSTLLQKQVAEFLANIRAA
ncbi:MAG: globin-coupled sensor protein [Alphaproteobacteria bacterium]|nr:MAG: globin-coupled sensor protein [Alphaproteobacteria bacterium]